MLNILKICRFEFSEKFHEFHSAQFRVRLMSKLIDWDELRYKFRYMHLKYVIAVEFVIFYRAIIRFMTYAWVVFWNFTSLKYQRKEI